MIMLIAVLLAACLPSNAAVETAPINEPAAAVQSSEPLAIPSAA